MNLSPALARSIIEALGASGTPPDRGVHHFNVGNRSLVEALDTYYFSSYLQDGGAAFKVVVGDYGSGKSHFLYCLRDVAWARGFAVVIGRPEPRRDALQRPAARLRRGRSQYRVARGRGRLGRGGLTTVSGGYPDPHHR